MQRREVPKGTADQETLEPLILVSVVEKESHQNSMFLTILFPSNNGVMEFKKAHFKQNTQQFLVQARDLMMIM